MGGMQETIEQYVTRLQTLAGDDPFSILRATPDRLAALLARVEPALLARRVDPDKWSIAEIAAHLADAELVVAYRARTILAENAAPIAAYDQNAWAASLEYASQDAFVSARLFAAYRMGTLRVADAVDPARLDHYGVHQERGRETVRQLLRLAAGHDVNHLRPANLPGRHGPRSRRCRSISSSASTCASARSSRRRRFPMPTGWRSSPSTSASTGGR